MGLQPKVGLNNNGITVKTGFCTCHKSYLRTPVPRTEMLATHVNNNAHFFLASFALLYSFQTEPRNLFHGRKKFMIPINAVRLIVPVLIGTER